eukprot:3737977-Prymnesium_polylepis.1
MAQHGALPGASGSGARRQTSLATLTRHVLGLKTSRAWFFASGEHCSWDHTHTCTRTQSY